MLVRITDQPVVVAKVVSSAGMDQSGGRRSGCIGLQSPKVVELSLHATSMKYGGRLGALLAMQSAVRLFLYR